MRVTDEDIADALMRLARARGPAKSFCPSEAARALADDWHALMPEVRRVASGLPLVATRRGVEVSHGEAHGPIRLRLANGA